MTRIIFTGINELIAAFSAIEARQIAATRTGLSKSLSLIEREAKTALSVTGSGPGGPGRNTKTGRFTKGAGGTPSMPGTPPHLQSGDLRRSVKQSPIEQIGRSRFKGDVGPTIEYGRIQELGGVAGRGSVLPSRPYMQPSFEKMLPEIAVVFREEWAWALRG
jgi:phage gpG-like protein